MVGIKCILYITLVCTWVCVCFSHSCVCRHSSERTHIIRICLPFWTLLNRTMCALMKDLPPPRSSVYKRMDTIRQRDQTSTFVCVCEPGDRHKRQTATKSWDETEKKLVFVGKSFFFGRGRRGKMSPSSLYTFSTLSIRHCTCIAQQCFL